MNVYQNVSMLSLIAVFICIWAESKTKHHKGSISINADATLENGNIVLKVLVIRFKFASWSLNVSFFKLLSQMKGVDNY